MNYERGLAHLELALKAAGVSPDDDLYLDIVGLQGQMHASLEEERRFAGLGPQAKADRARVLRELDRLSLHYGSKGFAQLCSMSPLSGTSGRRAGQPPPQDYRLAALENELQIRLKKMRHLRIVLAREAGAAIKFQLEQELKDEEAAIDRLNQELDGSG